jgi:hypothetical protein
MIGTTLALTAALAGTAVSAAGQLYGGIKQKGAANAAASAEEQAAESQAQLDEYNAGVAEVQAVDAQTRGELAVQQIQQQVKQVIGGQRAAFAAGSIDVSSGSAAEVQADAAYLGAIDAATSRNNAAREAWGYRVQKEDLLKQAEITRRTGKAQGDALRAQGSAALAGSLFGAAGSLLSGASLLSRRYGFVGATPAGGDGDILNAEYS